MKKSTLFQLIGGVLLAGGGLYIFFRDVDPAGLVRDLKAAPLTAVIGTVLLTLLTLWLRAVRWNLILPPSAGASRRDLFGMVMIGFMVNNLLPARLGEATRVLLLWKRNRFTVAQSVGSVLLERIIDSFFFLSFFCVPVLLLPGLRPLLPYATPMAVACGAFLVVLVLYAVAPSLCIAVFKKVSAVLPARLRLRIIQVCRDLVSNLHWLFDPWKFLVMVPLSFVIVFCHALMMMLLVGERGFGFFEGLFSSACAALGAAIPLSPGYVGTLHAALKQGFVMCGISPAKAAAVATLYHAIGYVTVTAFGLWFFFRMKLTFADINKAKETVNKETAV